MVQNEINLDGDPQLMGLVNKSPEVIRSAVGRVDRHAQPRVVPIEGFKV